MNDEAPEGYRRVWVPAPDWKMGGDGRRCRMKNCQQQAVAALKRKHHSRSGVLGFRWWHYCGDHLYAPQN